MDTPQPLRVHIGKDKPPLILLNNQLLGRLSRFQLYAEVEKALITTHYEVQGCFPNWDPPPDDGMSNASYPLRMSFSHECAQALVTFQGRPIGHLQGVTLDLTPDVKPVIRLFCIKNKLPEEVAKALVDLGVELVIDAIFEDESC